MPRVFLRGEARPREHRPGSYVEKDGVIMKQ
jgi:hypothetical protein